jgi:hypothetical protein
MSACRFLTLGAFLLGLATSTLAQPVLRKPRPSMGIDVFQLARPGIHLVLPDQELYQLRLEPYVRVPLGTEK